jgi:hypothetical protein
VLFPAYQRQTYQQWTGRSPGAYFRLPAVRFDNLRGDNPQTTHQGQVINSILFQHMQHRLGFGPGLSPALLPFRVSFTVDNFRFDSKTVAIIDIRHPFQHTGIFVVGNHQTDVKINKAVMNCVRRRLECRATARSKYGNNGSLSVDHI